MKIVVASESFKGSMTSSEACEAIARGILSQHPGSEIVICPIADGGDGTVSALKFALPGAPVAHTWVTGPMGSSVDAEVILVGENRNTAVIDMASASGLLLVLEGSRDPMRASTYGTGELMRFALSLPGVTDLIIGLGGSATNDCGAGCLQALGFELLSENGTRLSHPTLPSELKNVDRISSINVKTQLLNAQITLAIDVDNPLIGNLGASRVFGPQKGATPETVEKLESLLVGFGSVLDRYALDQGLRIGPVSQSRGAGAAGGLGAALIAVFPNCKVTPGIDIVLDYSCFNHALKDADLVVTGEGRLDSQTLHGKAVSGVLSRAKCLNIPVSIICGTAENGVISHMMNQGVRDVIELGEISGSSDSAMNHAAKWAAVAGAMLR